MAPCANFPFMQIFVSNMTLYMTNLLCHFTEICNANEVIYMRHLIPTFCMNIITVLMAAAATIALPACPSVQTKRYRNFLVNILHPRVTNMLENT